MKINEDFLKEQGFSKTGKKHGYDDVWEKPIMGRFFFLRFVMGDYPPSNPNVGVLGIYMPEQEIKAIPPDLIEKENWSKEDKERARTYTKKMSGGLYNFVFYLDDQERFKRIIDDITFTRKP